MDGRWMECVYVSGSGDRFPFALILLSGRYFRCSELPLLDLTAGVSWFYVYVILYCWWYCISWHFIWWCSSTYKITSDPLYSPIYVSQQCFQLRSTRNFVTNSSTLLIRLILLLIFSINVIYYRKNSFIIWIYSFWG